MLDEPIGWAMVIVGVSFTAAVSILILIDIVRAFIKAMQGKDT